LLASDSPHELLLQWTNGGTDAHLMAAIDLSSRRFTIVDRLGNVETTRTSFLT